MSDDELKARLARLNIPKPDSFDPEWAKFLLSVQEGGKRRSLAEGIGIYLAVVASLGGALVSLFNAYAYWSDRDGRAAKEDREAQISVVRIYFDRVAALPQGRQSCPEIQLYANAALAMAGLSIEDVERRVATVRTLATATNGHLPAPSASSPTLTTAAAQHGFQGTAAIIYLDLRQRFRDVCDNSAIGVAAASFETVADATPIAEGDASSYGLAQRRSPASASTGATAQISVYVQYQRDNAVAQGRANAIVSRLRGDGTFDALSIEGVRQVPDADQIRIYRREDETQARQLKDRLDLPQAQIVNLSTAFANLPARTMEVWLGRGSIGR